MTFHQSVNDRSLGRQAASISAAETVGCRECCFRRRERKLKLKRYDETKTETRRALVSKVSTLTRWSNCRITTKRVRTYWGIGGTEGGKGMCDCMGRLVYPRQFKDKFTRAVSQWKLIMHRSKDQSHYRIHIGPKGQQLGQNQSHWISFFFRI